MGLLSKLFGSEGKLYFYVKFADGRSGNAKMEVESVGMDLKEVERAVIRKLEAEYDSIVVEFRIRDFISN